MSDRMPLDDQQVSRNAMGQMAEQTKILHDELVRVGFSGGMADDMVLVWWKALMANTFTPDFASILGGLLKTEEDDE